MADDKKKKISLSLSLSLSFCGFFEKKENF
jgi:hypothetical protein